MDHQTPSRADTLREAAAVADARTESHTVSAVADVLRRMADAAESQRTGRMVCTPPALTVGSGCICRTDPADGPAHEQHAKWCPASHPTAERIAEIRQGTGDALTRDELYWLSGAAGRYEAHVIGASGYHWPLMDDLPGAVVLLAQYLAAAVAVIEKSQPYASTFPSWQKSTPSAPTICEAKLSCTCARAWNLHSKDCALYVPGHELISGSPATDSPFSSDDALELTDTTPCTRPGCGHPYNGHLLDAEGYANGRCLSAGCDCPDWIHS